MITSTSPSYYTLPKTNQIRLLGGAEKMTHWHNRRPHNLMNQLNTPKTTVQLNLTLEGQNCIGPWTMSRPTELMRAQEPISIRLLDVLISKAAVREIGKGWRGRVDDMFASAYVAN